MNSFENCIVVDFFFNGAKTEREIGIGTTSSRCNAYAHTYTLMCLMCTGKKMEIVLCYAYLDFV